MVRELSIPQKVAKVSFRYGNDDPYRNAKALR